ncbi:MAG TPA: N-acetylmuramoyl-L-alanine amidase [Candidatus Cybelea sp.]|nr:N-acetylmuramoyl-L-alanine amidase [Candidatus Cybelea sp.]
MKIVQCSSPNHDARPDGGPIDILVLHYTGMKTADEALARLTDAASKVSAHFTIGRDGRVFAHVPEERRAWHAGVSYWAGERNVNARSIGIELVNPGHEFGYVPFTDEQIGALIDLSRGILSRHPIPPARVIGHSDVAPARKTDPGELFPWQQLTDYGIGVWPDPSSVLRRSLARASTDTSPVNGEGKLTADDLSRFGYGVPPEVDVPISTVITAFQRHFRPTNVNGLWDDDCAQRLGTLLAKA